MSGKVIRRPSSGEKILMHNLNRHLFLKSPKKI